jgi:hypothetical protein
LLSKLSLKFEKNVKVAGLKLAGKICHLEFCTSDMVWQHLAVSDLTSGHASLALHTSTIAYHLHRHQYSF